MENNKRKKKNLSSYNIYFLRESCITKLRIKLSEKLEKNVKNIPCTFFFNRKKWQRLMF